MTPAFTNQLAKKQEPPFEKRRGLGAWSLVLTIAGLLLTGKANWEYVGLGMVITGLILALIPEKEERSGAAKATLILLGVVAIGLLILILLSFTQLFRRVP